MKKLFSALSFALVCGLVATAATPTQVKRVISSQPIKAQNGPYRAVQVDANGNKIKHVKRQAPSLESFLNADWQWEGESRLSGTGGLSNQGFIGFKVMETDTLDVPGIDPNAPRILIQGFDEFADSYYGGLRGYYDASIGYIYIPNQWSSPEEEYYGGTKFINYTYRNGTEADRDSILKENPTANVPEKFYMLVKAPEGVNFFLAIDEDGYLCSNMMYSDPGDKTENFTDAQLQAGYAIAADQPISNENGYYWLCGPIIGQPLAAFEFHPNEWEEGGESAFYDAWINPLLKTPVPEYNVPTYRNVLDNTTFLLLDPYGPDTPWGEGEFNESADEGYIVFTYADPDCVLFQPLVYSLTMSFDNSEEQDGSDLDYEQLYLYNYEGYNYYVSGLELRQIKSVLNQRGFDVSSVSMTNDRQIDIFNPVFAMKPAYSFGTLLSFNSEAGGYIILPEEWAWTPGSVEGVQVDNSNAPVEYYNIQGMRVLNPEKGQLVIKRQGSKVQKLIVR